MIAHYESIAPPPHISIHPVILVFSVFLNHCFHRRGHVEYRTPHPCEDQYASIQHQVSNSKFFTRDRWILFNEKKRLYEDQRGGKCGSVDRASPPTFPLLAAAAPRATSCRFSSEAVHRAILPRLLLLQLPHAPTSGTGT